MVDNDTVTVTDCYPISLHSFEALTVFQIARKIAGYFEKVASEKTSTGSTLHVFLL